MSSKNKSKDTLKSGLTVFENVLGQEFRLDYGGDHDPEGAKQEREAMADIQQAAEITLERFHDKPEMLKLLMSNRNPAPQTDHNTPETVMSWDELYERYVKKEEERVLDPTHKITEKSFKDYRPHRELWAKYFAGREVHAIKRAEVQEIESWLRNLPTRLTKRNISIADGINMAKQGGHDLNTLSAASYNHYQRQLAGLLKFAHKLGVHRDDLSVCIGQMNAKLGQETFRVPFTPEDMQAMFCGQDYASNFGPASQSTPLAARFWVPLIAAFTGARMDEICQLKISDVRRHDTANCHYLHLAGSDETAPDGKQKNIKNKNSIRPLPIHETLLDIGFLQYLESLKKLDKESSLFGLDRANDDKWGSPLSKWFTRKGSTTGKGFIERCGIISSGDRADGKRWSKTFHCFRHTVVTNLRDKSKVLPDGSRINAEDIALVVGHLEEESLKLETHSYGEAVENMGFRRGIISLIKYPGVDFDSIRWT